MSERRVDRPPNESAGCGRAKVEIGREQDGNRHILVTELPAGQAEESYLVRRDIESLRPIVTMEGFTGTVPLTYWIRDNWPALYQKMRQELDPNRVAHALLEALQELPEFRQSVE